MSEFGLIGKNISYSFSKTHFMAKFKNEDLPYSYENFDIEDVSEITNILQEHKDLMGFNVTIPYKEKIAPYLDSIDKKAKKIGAINTVKITKKGKLKGYNTDYYGFLKSIVPFLKSHHKKALILGTGGASKAIAYALKRLKIKHHYVSRTQKTIAKYTYTELTDAIISDYPILINCTPIGTHPNVNSCPDIPYNGITKNHLLYDLIYNPEQTKFLLCGELKGAKTCNGLKMLELQAEKSWKIWNKT